MASELSKLIEDQLQKVDEESGVPPSEKQRLLSSSLRIKTSPGKKADSKRSPIVKLGATKEQPADTSVSGSSVPVPSGQSWVTASQGFQWTKWRVMVGAGVAVAIVIALAVAFSHPSSKLHHSDVIGYAQGGDDFRTPVVMGGSRAPALTQPTQPQGMSQSSAVPMERTSASALPSGAYGEDDAALLAAPAAGSGAAAASTPGVSSGHRAGKEGTHHKEGHGHHKAFHPVGAAAQQQQPLAGGAAALTGARLGAGGRAQGPSAAGMLAGAMAPGKALPPSKVASLAPKVAASWFGAPAPMKAAQAYAPALLKAMAPSAAAQEPAKKKSFWTAVKEKAGLKPKESPPKSAWNTPAGDEEAEEGTKSWATKTSNTGWDTPAAAGSRWDTESSAGSSGGSSSSGRAVPAVASATKALAAREPAGAGATPGDFGFDDAPPGGEGSLPQAAASSNRTGGGGNAFDQVHGGVATAQTEEEEEAQEEEGGIFDTIAGTPSEDEQGSTASEDDEWLGEDGADMDVSGGVYAAQDEEGDETEGDLRG